MKGFIKERTAWYEMSYTWKGNTIWKDLKIVVHERNTKMLGVIQGWIRPNEIRTGKDTQKKGSNERNYSYSERLLKDLWRQ
jgi:hypothetical protein